MSRLIRVICLVVLLVTVAPVTDAHDRLLEDFWIDLAPTVPPDPFEPEPNVARALELLLDEARFIFSGMIYGLRFVFVPSDRARDLPETFELSAVHDIPWGDPRLDVFSTHRDGTLVHAKLRYRPAEHELVRLRGWSSTAVAIANGAGSSSIHLGPESRRLAIENAVKNAVREHLRTRHFNKPREATGLIAFEGAPRIYIDRGAYHARIAVKIRVENVRAYETF